MTQKIYFLHLVFHFQTTLAFQLCVIIHDLYNDFSRRHLLVSRLFSNVPNVTVRQYKVLLFECASGAGVVSGMESEHDNGHEDRR